jgi:hypothetical protein
LQREQVDGEGVDAALMAHFDVQPEVVEGGEPVDPTPNLLVVGVEGMGPVLVNMNTLHRPGVTVPGDVRSLVDDQGAKTLFRGGPGEDAAIKTGPDDQQVIFLRHGHCD